MSFFYKSRPNRLLVRASDFNSYYMCFNKNFFNRLKVTFFNSLYETWLNHLVVRAPDFNFDYGCI